MFCCPVFRRVGCSPDAGRYELTSLLTSLTTAKAGELEFNSVVAVRMLAIAKRLLAPPPVLGSTFPTTALTGLHSEGFVVRPVRDPAHDRDLHLDDNILIGLVCR